MMAGVRRHSASYHELKVHQVITHISRQLMLTAKTYSYVIVELLPKLRLQS